MSVRPTVCHVTSVHVSNDGRILYHECRSLATRYRTLLLVRDDGPDRVAEGVEIRTLPKTRSRLERFVANGRLLRAAMATEADLFHFHDPELLPAMATLAQATAKPVVYDAHEDYPAAMTQKSWIPRSLRPLASSLADRTERRNVPRLSAVVVADEALERRFNAMHPRVVRLDNYPPLSLFGSPRPTLQGPPTMLYVGSVSKVRGFLDMIEVLELVRASVPGARLVVYGRPTEEVTAMLPGLRGRFPEGALEMRGPLPYGELPAALAEAHLGLSLLRPHPKYEHNVSMKVFDYMAAGVPWVASDFAPLRSGTDNGTGGELVPPGDPAAAARAILGLLADRPRAESLGRAGRALVEARLNWESVEPKLFGLYEQLLRVDS